MTTQLLLVRHGQVVGAHKGRRVSGVEDPPLSEKGRISAELLGRRLAEEGGIAAIYTSPLQRARETATILATHLYLEPQDIADLREWDFRREMGTGDRLRLLIVTTLSHIQPFRRLLAYQWTHSPALQAYVRTVAGAIQYIVQANPNKRVVVVGHGGMIDALLTHYFPAEDEWERGVICNCSMTQINVESGVARLLAFNDCEHLKALSK